MRRDDLTCLVSLLLLAALLATVSTGLLQARLGLRQFVPHRRFAYATAVLTVLHVAFNASKLWRYLRRRLKGGSRSSGEVQ